MGGGSPQAPAPAQPQVLRPAPEPQEKIKKIRKRRTTILTGPAGLQDSDVSTAGTKSLLGE